MSESPLNNNIHHESSLNPTSTSSTTTPTNDSCCKCSNEVKSETTTTTTTSSTQHVDLSLLSSHRLLFKWIEESKFSFGVIDLRDTTQYEKKHIKHSTSIPFNELSTRIFELPPRGHTIGFVYSKSNVNDSTKLESLQKIMDDLVYRSGYIVNFVINLEDDNDHLWDKLTRLDVVSSGNHSRLLWQACNFLKDSIQEIEDSFLKDDNMRTMKALDLGCGSGRDCLFLAKRGWSVVAIDNNDNLLQKVIEAANRYGLNDGRIQTHNIDLEPIQYDQPSLDTDYSNTQPKTLTAQDLEKLSQLQTTLLNLSSSPLTTQQSHQQSELGYELVHVARYLFRPLLPIIASIIKPGGWVVYHTFMVPSMGKPKRPRFLLNYNELKERFISSNFEIIKYEETKLEDGRPVQFLLARKPF